MICDVYRRGIAVCFVSAILRLRLEPNAKVLTHYGANTHQRRIVRTVQMVYLTCSGWKDGPRVLLGGAITLANPGFGWAGFLCGLFSSRVFVTGIYVGDANNS